MCKKKYSPPISTILAMSTRSGSVYVSSTSISFTSAFTSAGGSVSGSWQHTFWHCCVRRTFRRGSSPGFWDSLDGRQAVFQTKSGPLARRVFEVYVVLRGLPLRSRSLGRSGHDPLGCHVSYVCDFFLTHASFPAYLVVSGNLSTSSVLAY